MSDRESVYEPNYKVRLLDLEANPFANDFVLEEARLGFDFLEEELKQRPVFALVMNHLRRRRLPPPTQLRHGSLREAYPEDCSESVRSRLVQLPYLELVKQSVVTVDFLVAVPRRDQPNVLVGDTRALVTFYKWRRTRWGKMLQGWHCGRIDV